MKDFFFCAALTRSSNAIWDEGVCSVFEVDFDDSNKTLKSNVCYKNTGKYFL